MRYYARRYKSFLATCQAVAVGACDHPARDYTWLGVPICKKCLEEYGFESLAKTLESYRRSAYGECADGFPAVRPLAGQESMIEGEGERTSVEEARRDMDSMRRPKQINLFSELELSQPDVQGLFD